MKSKLVLLLCLPLLAFGAQTRQGPSAAPAGSGPVANDNYINSAGCPLDLTTPATPTTIPASDLLLAIEEERVAHDIYVAASAKWNPRVFVSIAAAEVRHAAALTQLAASAGVIPAAAQTGVYVSADLQHLHDQLLVLVNESQTGALRAGALIEETDIADLRRMSGLATDAASQAVLANLEQASGHHLAAFVRNLAAVGVTYQPQVLAADDFATLINSAPDRGGNCNAGNFGGGRGFRGGR